MEVEEGKRVVCPLPCNLASLLSMNCRTRAEGLARRFQAHLKQDDTSNIEATWLVQTGEGVKVSTSEGRTYSLDDHQLESFKRAADLKGLRPIHVVTSEPTLHLCFPSQPSQADLASKADHEQDSDVYYDFDLVTPPEDYANPGTSRMTSREVILEENEKQERPESGCVTSVTSPVMFHDDFDLTQNNPPSPSPVDDSCPPELLNRRSSDVDFDAVRKILSSSNLGCLFPENGTASKLSCEDLDDDRQNGNGCSSSASSDDVEISLSFYDDDEESLMQPSNHASLEENRTDIFSPSATTFQSMVTFDTSFKNHACKSVAKRKNKTANRNSHCKSNSDLSPAVNKIQSESQTHDSNVDATRPMCTRIYTNKLPYDLTRSHSLEGSLKENKNNTRVFATARSLDKIGRGSCELFGRKNYDQTVKVECVPELHLQRKNDRQGSFEDLYQLPEDVSHKCTDFNTFLNNTFHERYRKSEIALTKGIYRNLVTESQPTDENSHSATDIDHPNELTTLDGTDIINDIDNIIDRLKNEGIIGKKLANYEDMTKEKYGTDSIEKEMPVEKLQQVAFSYIGGEFGARGRCQEEVVSGENCDLYEKQVPYHCYENAFSNEESKQFNHLPECQMSNENNNLISRFESSDTEMYKIGGQIKVKRANSSAQPPLSLGAEELLETSGTSFSEPCSSAGEQTREQGSFHEANSISQNLYNDTNQCLGQSKGVCDNSVKSKACCENKNKEADDILLDFSPVKSISCNQYIVNGSDDCSPNKQCNFFSSFTISGSEGDLKENDNVYLTEKYVNLNESENIELENSDNVDLISPSEAVSLCEKHNRDTYKKSSIDCSTNPFLKDIVESFHSETFHLFTNAIENESRNVDQSNIDYLDNATSTENGLNSHNEGERELFRQLFNQNSHVEGNIVDHDRSSSYEKESGYSESLSITSTDIAPNILDWPYSDNLEQAENSIMLSDNVQSKTGENMSSGRDDVSQAEIVSDSHSVDEDVSERNVTNLSNLEDLKSSELILNDPTLTNHIVDSADDDAIQEYSGSGNVLAESDNAMASQDSEKNLPSAAVDTEFGSFNRNDGSAADNIFVAIEEPGVLCLVQQAFNGNFNDAHKDNILVRRDSAERDIQLEIEPQRSVVSENDDDEEFIECLPESESKSDEDDESDEEIVLPGKFKNVAEYYKKETIHHISDEDGTLPLPPTEVIIVDLTEPIRPPKEEEEQTEGWSSALANELERLEMEDPSVQPPSSDSERSSEERDNGDLQLRIKRSSSLKCGKTPPGTPGRKKIVRFADALGLDLAAIRTYLDGVPNVPPSAFCDLQVEQDAETAPQPQGFPSFASYSAAASAAAAALQNQARRILTPMFQQPGALPDFYDRLREHKVVLENVAVGSDLSVKGVVRVINEDFQKKVHIRYTFDQWKNHHEATATYVDGSSDGFSDRFSFLLWGSFLQSNGALIFCVKYTVKNREYWDNNRGSNYVLQCYSAPSIPLSAAPVDEQSQFLMGRPQNHGNIEHRENREGHTQSFNSDFGHHEHHFNSFMDTPNTPADPWIPRFF